MLLEAKSKLFSKEYKETIQEALQVLGKKNLALIVQGVSFPSKNNENTGFGTYNSDGAKALFDYTKDIFSAIHFQYSVAEHFDKLCLFHFARNYYQSSLILQLKLLLLPL